MAKKKIKDKPLNMPCDDPEGCPHFKAEMRLRDFVTKVSKYKKFPGDHPKYLNFLAKQALTPEKE